MWSKDSDNEAESMQGTRRYVAESKADILTASDLESTLTCK